MKHFEHPLKHKPSELLWRMMLAFSVFLFVCGLVLSPWDTLLPGLAAIHRSPDVLISDYFIIGGMGATMLNAGLVTLASLLLTRRLGLTYSGLSVAAILIMGGFALFGKNLVNCLPILFGNWLFARYQEEKWNKYIVIGLFSTCLAPFVSFLYNALSTALWLRVAAAAGIGVVIGFVLPPLSAYTYKIQNGMNLYNMGFACGLLAMILVPVMSSMGANPTVAHHWAEGYNLHFAIFLGVLCLGLTVAGFFFSGRPAWAAWAGYRRLLRTTGRAPSDYLRMFGPAPVLINMGVNGLIGMAFILATGGDLNGPTLGGILTIMGFSAFGKHARNITPIMLGVVIGGVFMHFDINQSSVQLALLFGTTLAPISGYFGWPFGIVAGFLHSSVVLHAGTPVEGINLYNNGFSGGLLAIVLYPIISEAIRHHRPGLQDRDYFDDTIEHDEPLVPPPARRK